MKSLLDKSFVYTPAAKQGDGYLQKKFAEIREKQKQDESRDKRLDKIIRIQRKA